MLAFGRHRAILICTRLSILILFTLANCIILITTSMWFVSRKELQFLFSFAKAFWLRQHINNDKIILIVINITIIVIKTLTLCSHNGQDTWGLFPHDEDETNLVLIKGETTKTSHFLMSILLTAISINMLYTSDEVGVTRQSLSSSSSKYKNHLKYARVNNCTDNETDYCCESLSDMIFVQFTQNSFLQRNINRLQLDCVQSVSGLWTIGTVVEMADNLHTQFGWANNFVMLMKPLSLHWILSQVFQPVKMAAKIWFLASYNTNCRYLTHSLLFELNEYKATWLAVSTMSVI